MSNPSNKTHGAPAAQLHPIKLASLIGSIGLISLIGLISHIPEAKASGLLKPANNLGLVGYWSMEDGRGSIATDFSGNGNNGVFAGGATWTGGKIGKATSFHDYASSDSINIPYSPSLSITGDLSISTWFKINTLDADEHRIVSNWGVSQQYLTNLRANQFLFAARGPGYINQGYVVSGATFSAGTWYHVVSVKSGTFLYLYTNGALTDSVDIGITTLNTSTSSISIGNENTGSAEFDGLLDEVRIYNRALSATEVSALYNASLGTKINTSVNTRGPQNGLIGQWSFDGQDISGTTAYDRSGQGNNGTLTNGPVGVKGKFGQALKCDGSNDYVYISSFDQTLTSATFTAWVKLKSYQPASGIIFSRSIGITGMDLSYGDSTRLGYHWNGLEYYFAGPSLPLDKWVFAAVTVTPTNAVAYVGSDEVLTSVTNNATSSASHISTLNIGRDPEAPRFFDGLIDDARVYNRALTAAEIAELYNLGNATKINSATADPLSANLVLWHTFDGQKLNTTTSTDSVVDGHDGTLLGPTPVKGKRGQALRFDGINDYIETSSNFTITDPLTITAWINKKTNVAWSSILIRYAGASVDCFALGLDPESSGAKIMYEWNNTSGNGWTNRVASNTSIPTGEWAHVAAVTDGSNVSLYLNGQYDGGGAVGAVCGSGPLQVGINAAGTVEYFDGMIDDVRLYNKALTAAEVLQLYNATK